MLTVPPTGSPPWAPAGPQDPTDPLTAAPPLVTDADLIAESVEDSERFGALYDRYAPMLYRFAARRLGGAAAQDVVAETFLAAFRGRRRYDLSRPDARPWLFGILIREIAGRHRDETRRLGLLSRVHTETDQEGPEDRVSASVSAESLREDLAAALAALSRADRDVLLLIAWAQFSYPEVALALDVPIGTVRSRLHRARRQLRASLGNINPLQLTEEF